MDVNVSMKHREKQREREEEKKERKKEEISTPYMAVHRLNEEEKRREGESSVRPLPSPTVSGCC